MSLGHWIIVALVVLVMFGLGKGKIPQIMGDVGKGLRSFKDGLKGEEGKDNKQEVLPPDDKKGS